MFLFCFFLEISWNNLLKAATARSQPSQSKDWLRGTHFDMRDTTFQNFQSTTQTTFQPIESNICHYH